MIMGDNGIIAKAQIAKERTNASQSEEENKLKDLEDYLNGRAGGLSEAEVDAKIEEALGRVGSSYTITKLGENTSTTAVSIDASLYDQLYIETWNSQSGKYCVYNIPTVTLISGGKTYISSAAWETLGDWSTIRVSTTSARLDQIKFNGTDCTSTSKITVYGIKY